MTNAFEDPNIDLVDRLGACADVSGDDVAPLLREASAALETLRIERDAYAAKVANSLASKEQIERLGELTIITKNSHDTLLAAMDTLGVLVTHARVQQGIPELWPEAQSKQGRLLQAALRQLHHNLIRDRKKPALVLPRYTRLQ
jgi:hypothetical protein